MAFFGTCSTTLKDKTNIPLIDSFLNSLDYALEIYLTSITEIYCFL